MTDTAVRTGTATGDRNATSRSRGLMWAAAGIAVWATNAAAAGVALRHYPLGPVLVVMCAAATLTLLVVRAAQRRRRPVAMRPLPHRTGLVGGMVIGVVGLAGTLVFQYVGFADAPLVEANVISYGWPMFAAVALAVTIRNRTSAAALGCALVGFAGVAVMFTGSTGTTGGSVIGYGASLGSAVCMALYTLAIARVRLAQVDVLLIGAVAALTVAVVYDALTTGTFPLGVPLLGALYCGIGPVAGGYLLWSRAMTLTHGRLAPLGYAIPLLSSCLLLATGAPFTTRTLAGGTLIIACSAGVLINDRISHTRRL